MQEISMKIDGMIQPEVFILDDRRRGKKILKIKDVGDKSENSFTL